MRSRNQIRIAARLAMAALLVLVVMSLGSCRFLADEFVWLDRAGPVADFEPDAPTIGTADRP